MGSDQCEVVPSVSLNYSSSTKLGIFILHFPFHYFGNPRHTEYFWKFHRNIALWECGDVPYFAPHNVCVTWWYMFLCYHFWNSVGDIVNEGIDLFLDRFNNNNKGPENPTESHVVRCKTFPQCSFSLEFPNTQSRSYMASLTECIWKFPK